MRLAELAATSEAVRATSKRSEKTERLADALRRLAPGEVDDDVLTRVTATMPLRKIAQPEDVARQVVVLASDELSGHVTGQVVVVAGGMEGRLLHGPR